MRWRARVTSTEAAQPAAGWDGEGEKDELRATPTYARDYIRDFSLAIARGSSRRCTTTHTQRST
jgi:hypothetical protein